MNITTYLPYKYPTLILIGLMSLIVGYGFYHTYNAKNKPELVLFSPINNCQETVKGITQKGLTVAKAVKSQLDQEFAYLLEKLQKEYPISEQKWQEYMDKFEALKKDDNLLAKGTIYYRKSSDPLIAKVQELLVSYGINPQSVTIETIHDAKNASYAFAGQYCKDGKVLHFIKLNMAQLPKQKEPVQIALLRHEVMHLLNYDSLAFGIIEKLLREHGITDKEFNKNAVYSNLNKLIEYRADLMASADLETAQALKDAFAEHMSRYDDNTPSNSHPSCKSRIAAVDNLMHYMHEENKLLMA